MNLDNVHRGIHKHKRPKRVGRGPGSGHGKTSGRGHKGQKSRSGWSRHPTFQGGVMPLIRRVPKRGFHNRFAPVIAIVNVADLERAFPAHEQVTPQRIATQLVRHPFDQLKILGNGQLTKPLEVAAHRFSKSAIQKIQQAGGTVITVSKRSTSHTETAAASVTAE